MSDLQATTEPETATPDALLTSDVAESAPARPKYSRLGPEEVAEILRLKRLNPDVTLDEIAAVIGCSASTVCYWLNGFTDTTEDALQVLQSDALPAALTLGELMRGSKHDKIKLDAAKANLTANKLLGNEDQRITVGVQVVLGVPAGLSEP